jgi:hypothetical protein
MARVATRTLSTRRTRPIPDDQSRMTLAVDTVGMTGELEAASLATTETEADDDADDDDDDDCGSSWDNGANGKSDGGETTCAVVDEVLESVIVEEDECVHACSTISGEHKCAPVAVHNRSMSARATP